jgi:FKBP-type peptidyl-prolyl cis-trans isomerase SlyD
MTITKNSVVAIDYTLTGDDNEVIDTSKGRSPLEYMHGQGNIIPGLENALEGKGEGETLKVNIAPADGYGEYNPKLVQPVPRANFGAIDKIEVGMQFKARTPQGVHVVRVVTVDPENVTVDANHPLAGKTLHFDVKVVSVRGPRPEELEHQHVCNEGGDCGKCGCGGEH